MAVGSRAGEVLLEVVARDLEDAEVAVVDVAGGDRLVVEPGGRLDGAIADAAVGGRGQVELLKVHAVRAGEAPPGARRLPVVVVQGDALNRSRIRTVVCVPLTSNLVWVEAPGNVLLPAKTTGLPKDSVANTSQIIALDRDLLTEEVGKLSKRQLELILSGIDVILGR